MKPILQIRDLRVDKAGSTICRLSELEVQQGERVAVIGPNGCGKTTLFRVIAGLESDFSGTFETDITRLGRVYGHQSPYFFRGSVMFNVCYGLVARGVTRKKRASMADAWLQRFNVEHLARRRCRDLSGGEQRRVALARAFAVQPKILLLDEPFAELDEHGMDIVRQAIAEESDATILISSPTQVPDTLLHRAIELDATT